MSSFLTNLENLLKENSQLVVATMVDHRGSAPQINGAKAIINKEGLSWGTVGGGKIENTVITKAKELLASSDKTSFYKWNLQKDIGMTCGGEVSFFLEKYGEQGLDICVFGAGHVSQELIPLLLKLNCNIVCIDSRKEWLDKFPHNKNLLCLNYDEPADYVDQLSSGSFIISMTQGHSFDLPILKKVFDRETDFPFIGVIGSKQKAQVIKHELHDLGVDQRILERLVCPIGLDFGNNTPIEISFSIIAQILSEREIIS